MTKEAPLITERWLRNRKACRDGWVRVYHERWPDGAPAAIEVAIEARDAGIPLQDILWVAVRCLPKKADRRNFIVFTLRQRQPHLVKLFRRAELIQHAKAIAALDWSDLPEAERVLAAARDATRNAARDATRDARDAAVWEQIKWIAEYIKEAPESKVADAAQVYERGGTG